MSEESERGILQKTVDKVGLGISIITLPIGIYALGTAALAGELLKSGFILLFVGQDYIQITEHGKPVEKRSWFNLSRLVDRIIGSLRFKQRPSTRLAMAAA